MKTAVIKNFATFRFLLELSCPCVSFYSVTLVTIDSNQINHKFNAPAMNVKLRDFIIPDKELILQAPNLSHK